METVKYRDLQLVSIGDKQIVISCDSAGGIGEKINDIIKVKPEILGYTTAKVSLCEVLATGADIISVVDTLSVEMNPTGEKIIKGILNALEEIGLNNDYLTGSTEENFSSVQTGMGITVIGVLKEELPKTYEGDSILILGRASVGNEVIEYKSKLFDHILCKHLRQIKDIHEILPCGSKGILHEIKEIEKTSGLNIEFYSDINIDLVKSCGPATCAVITAKPEAVEEIIDNINIPYLLIGEIKRGK